MRRVFAASLVSLAALAAACGESPSEPDGEVRQYRVGETYPFNVQSQSGKSCTDADMRNGRVVTMSQRAIIVADVQNPTGDGTFTDQEYQEFARTFDERVWPVVTQHFGEPSDLDRNNRVIIFFTRAVNELTPRGQSWFVGGFFHPRDLFPQRGSSRFEACQASNQAELLYMLVPDPRGEVNGNARTKARELASTVNVIAHEMQHLVNASRRLYVVRAGGDSWNETVWLNEGLSHIAEELMAYAISPLAPRQNVDAVRLNPSGPERTAFGQHKLSNFGRLELYLKNPSNSSLIGPDSLSTRGATWQFLRYAADRRGGSESDLWKRLIDSNVTGLENLRGALGTDPMPWINDWAVSIYTDDAVPGIASEFTQPSWNFRSIYTSLVANSALPIWGRYPLEVRTLTPGSEAVVVPGGGAVYLRFGVQAGARAEIRFGQAVGECQTTTLAVGQVQRLTGSQIGTHCFNGGGAGADFAVIPFNASEVGSSRLSLTVTSNGTVTPTGLSEHEAVHRHDAPLSAAAAAALELHPGQQWEVRFREQAARELSRLVPGGSARVATPVEALGMVQTAAANDPNLRITIVRTR
jgi:hypothetical protein